MWKEAFIFHFEPMRFRFGGQFSLRSQANIYKRAVCDVVVVVTGQQELFSMLKTKNYLDIHSLIRVRGGAVVAFFNNCINIDKKLISQCRRAHHNLLRYTK